VIIFYDGQDYWLADGFHRVQGAKHFNIRNIRADIRQGTRRDAVLYSTGANGKHGLRRTNEDQEEADEADEDEMVAAAQYLDLNQRLKSYYDQLKVRSRAAARRIMRIGYRHSVEAAREAAIACLEVAKAEEKMGRDLAKARQENEQLRALLKENKITIPLGKKA
jgi:hypothetical protein